MRRVVIAVASPKGDAAKKATAKKAAKQAAIKTVAPKGVKEPTEVPKIKGLTADAAKAVASYLSYLVDGNGLSRGINAHRSRSAAQQKALKFLYNKGYAKAKDNRIPGVTVITAEGRKFAATLGIKKSQEAKEATKEATREAKAFKSLVADLSKSGLKKGKYGYYFEKDGFKFMLDKRAGL